MSMAPSIQSTSSLGEEPEQRDEAHFREAEDHTQSRD